MFSFACPVCAVYQPNMCFDSSDLLAIINCGLVSTMSDLQYVSGISQQRSNQPQGADFVNRLRLSYHWKLVLAVIAQARHDGLRGLNGYIIARVI